jgi:hypothetical protein
VCHPRRAADLLGAGREGVAAFYAGSASIPPMATHQETDRLRTLFQTGIAITSKL